MALNGWWILIPGIKVVIHKTPYATVQMERKNCREGDMLISTMLFAAGEWFVRAMKMLLL